MREDGPRPRPLRGVLDSAGAVHQPRPAVSRTAEQSARAEVGQSGEAGVDLVWFVVLFGPVKFAGKGGAK